MFVYEQEKGCGTETAQGEERIPEESDPRWKLSDCDCDIRNQVWISMPTLI
jgi:hypothetical protein